MGMFDTVVAKCPACGGEVAFQSKGGDCTLDRYDLEDAPQDVLSDTHRLGRHTECDDCGRGYKIEVKVTAVLKPD